METPGKGTVWDGARFHHAAQNGNAKLINCFFLEFSVKYFSGRGWSRVSETVESEILGEGGYHIGFGELREA